MLRVPPRDARLHVRGELSTLNKEGSKLSITSFFPCSHHQTPFSHSVVQRRKGKKMSAAGYYNQQSGGGYGQPPPPPNPPRPWFPEWDQREGRYIFINQQTGQRSYEFPREEYGGGGNSYGGYGGGQAGNYGGGQGGNYSGSGSGNYAGGEDYGAPPPQEQQQAKKSHGLLYGALGAAAGLAGGAFLMHEGEEVKDDLEGDKYRAEERFQGDEYRTDEGFDRFGNGVENFPDDAAQWTGEKVGEVEAIPQDIDQGFDRFGDRVEDGVQDVEDIPEDVVGWAGDKVGDVERFGDNIDDSYDAGRDVGRHGDDDY